MCVCGEVDSNAAVWRKVSAARAFTLAADRGAPQRRVQFRSASAAAAGGAAAAWTRPHICIQFHGNGAQGTQSSNLLSQSQTPLSKCINKF
jgi:hypothetical protein